MIFRFGRRRNSGTLRSLRERPTRHLPLGGLPRSRAGKIQSPSKDIKVMPERFRIKASKGWKGAMHVDHAPDLPRRIFELDNEL